MHGPMNTPLAGVVNLGREKCILCGRIGELRGFLVFDTVKCDWCGSLYPLAMQPLSDPRARALKEIREPLVDREAAMRIAMRRDRVAMRSAEKAQHAGAGRWKWGKCVDDDLTEKKKSRNLA